MDDDREPVAFDLDRRLLRCAECDRVSWPAAAGWRLARACDGDLVAYCADCWETEFEDGR